VQRATAQSNTGIFRDYGVAEAPQGFKAGWSDCMYFSLSFCSFCLLTWVFRVSFCTHEGTYRSLELETGSKLSLLPSNGPSAWR
jgi:hypothetical protein